jgi:PKD repeat protein
MYGLSSGDHYYIWHPDEDKNLAEWQAALPSGYVVAGSAAHNTIEDPLFVNAAGHNYNLSSGSPAASGGRGGSWPTYRGAYAPADGPPVAAFHGDLTSGAAPLTVTFTDQSSQSPTSWAWTFGDEGTSELQNPSHQYTGVGTYTVELIATNSYGHDHEVKTSYITVTAGGTTAFKSNVSGNISIGR